VNPFWSPDGRKIVFASERNGNRDIWTMVLDVAALEHRLEVRD